MAKWYTSLGEQSDTVISTRIRLARNIAGIPFPCKMNAEQINQVNMLVKDAVCSDKNLKENFKFIEMDTLPEITKLSLMERHIISPGFCKNSKGKLLILSNDESISIMLCEEDHIRIQVMCAGLALDQSYKIADKIDDVLDKRLTFAFNDRLGYLTECPTNLGTGLRASVMLHLPALEAGNSVAKLASTVGKIGLTIRGTYGEGSKASGALYQLSNQVTLGISELSAIENLKSITLQAINQEKSARESIDRAGIEDATWRALGTLRYARSMSSDEFMNLISKVRLGVSMNIIEDVTLEDIEALIVETSPATIQANAGTPLEADERDIQRSKIIRERLNR